MSERFHVCRQNGTSGCLEHAFSCVNPAISNVFRAIPGLLIVAPLLSLRFVLLLDGVRGPISVTSYRYFAGTVGQANILFDLLTASISFGLGSPVGSWFDIAVSLAFLVVTVNKLARCGCPQEIVASIFVVVNPFVFQRLFVGQLAVLFGYALLPLVTRSLILSVDRRGVAHWAGAGWIAFVGALDVHFIWIALVLLLAVVAWRHNLRTLLWGVLTLMIVAVLDAYLFVPYLLQKATVAVGSPDLAAFRTAGSSHYGLFVNVAGLYGFWRSGPILPKAYVPAWPILLAAILLVAGRGVWSALHNPKLRDTAGVLLIAGILAYFLALGSQGPTGFVFDFMYRHLPGFAVMREPEKFSALLALAYAVFFALGIQALVADIKSRRVQLAAGALALAAIVGYTPNIFWGLGGQIKPSRYPADYAVADKVMGTGPGRILSLPLNEYETFSYTGNRDIANPAPVVFSRRVIVGGIVDAGPLTTNSLSPENAYLQQVMALGPSVSDVGQLVAQLGVRYVVMFDTADWRSYSWISRQLDLKLVYSGPDVQVYRNASALPEGATLTASAALPNVACYAALASRENLTGVAVTLRSGTPCPEHVADPAPVFNVRRTSALYYHSVAGPSGDVVIPEAADGTWDAGGTRSVRLIDGVQTFVSRGTPLTVQVRAWKETLAADAFSASALIALCISVNWRLRVARRKGAQP